jgi:hypothetical protein
MASHGDLSDPDYEPTDEELQELARSAFEGVAARNELALRKLRTDITALSADLLRQRAAEEKTAK